MKALVFASLVVAVALILAGCGSSDNNSSASAQPGPGGQPPQANQEAFERFQQCLQDHGVSLPRERSQGGQPGQRPTFDAKTQEAFDACRQYLPARPSDGSGRQGFNGPST